MAIYLEFEGIKGNVTAEGFENHVLVDAVSFGVSRGLTMESGKMANREVGKPNVSEVSLSKSLLITQLLLYLKKRVSGSNGKKVTLKFVRTGSDKVEEFMSIRTARLS